MIHEFHNIIFKGLFLVMFLRQHSLFSHPLIFVFLLHEGNKKNTTSVNNINGLNLTGKLGEADFSLTLHFSFVIFLNKTPTFFCTCARLILLGCIPIKTSWKKLQKLIIRSYNIAQQIIWFPTMYEKEYASK